MATTGSRRLDRGDEPATEVAAHGYRHLGHRSERPSVLEEPGYVRRHIERCCTTVGASEACVLSHHPRCRESPTARLGAVGKPHRSSHPLSAETSASSVTRSSGRAFANREPPPLICQAIAVRAGFHFDATLSGMVGVVSYMGPTETWPDHGRPEARAALKDAAKAGWHFRPSSGHIFGTLKCSAIGQAGACTLPVFSTSGPADGSSTAKKIRSMLRKCPHQTGVDDERVEEQNLSDAELRQNVMALVAAVDGLNERDRAESAIDIAISNDDVDELDEQAERLDRGDNAAQMAFVQLGRPLVPWPPSVARDALLMEAESLALSITDPDGKQAALELVHIRQR